MAMAVALAWPARGSGQDQPPDHAKHDHGHQAAAEPTEAGDSFADQVQQLREKVAKLEAALAQGQGAGQSRPMGLGQAMGMGASSGWRVPAGYRIAAHHADCLRCHQTIPSGPPPPSHLERSGDSDMGMREGGGPGGRGKPEATPTTSNASPIEQLQQLRDKVAALDAALAQGHQGGRAPAGQGEPAPDMGMMGRGGMGNHQAMGMMGGGMMGGGMGMIGSEMRRGMMGQGGMGMGMMGRGGMGDHQGMDGGMGMGPAMGMMGGDMEMMGGQEMMGMGAMGKAKRMGMGHMGMASSLPGFPGISHLYHIGAEGFFLNHVEHITLSQDQRKKLNRIKEKALLGGSSCERNVEEAEQELWELTASDAPDAAAIEAKIREIEKHRGDQRMAFIRAVGEAAKVLTDEQRRALAGAAESSSRPATAKP
jgi:Spy/CpxP family protein refolding chaperone